MDNETIDGQELDELVAANDNKRGFTYTHFDVLANKHNRRVVRAANDNGFTVNLSANSLTHADELMELDCAPVTVVVTAAQKTNTRTPKGHKVIICPARVAKGVTCATCGMCARQRDVIIGFPALGNGRHKMDVANDNEPS